MKTLSQADIAACQHKILSWYQEHQRDLPWRKTRDPYAILVSEVMLQQTQVNRVIPKYEAWMQAFPSLYELAEATPKNILAYWSGLGYNRRALFLKNTAEVLVTEYHGQWPQEKELLKKLPGIGEYTVRAVMCFAFDAQLPVIDTNIRKVIAVEFFNGVLPDENIIAAVASQLLPPGKAYDWNQALMDYSSLVLQSEKIPVAKQSPYKTSRRFYRGKILKLLVSKEHSMADLEAYFLTTSGPLLYPLEDIISGLEKDGLVRWNGKKLTL